MSRVRWAQAIGGRMATRRAQGVDRGDTLIEILLSVMIVSITVTSLVSSLATAGNAGNVQRQSVVADTVLRNYAEAIKSGVRSCTSGGKYTVKYQAPDGYVLSVEPEAVKCPDPASTQVMSIVVTTPFGANQSMQIRVRTP